MSSHDSEQAERDRVQAQILEVLRQAANPYGRPGQRVSNRIMSLMSGSLFGYMGPNNRSNQQESQSLRFSDRSNRIFDKIAKFFGDKTSPIGTPSGRHTFQYDEMNPDGTEERKTATVDSKQAMLDFIKSLTDAGKVLSNFKYEGEELDAPANPLTRAMDSISDWLGAPRTDSATAKPEAKNERWFDKIAGILSSKAGPIGAATGKHTVEYDEIGDDGVEVRRTAVVDSKEAITSFIESLESAGRYITGYRDAGPELAGKQNNPMQLAMSELAGGIDADNANGTPTQGEDSVVAANEQLCEALDRNTTAQGASPTIPGTAKANTTEAAGGTAVSPAMKYIAHKFNVPIPTLQRFTTALGPAITASAAVAGAFTGFAYGLTFVGKRLFELADKAWKTTNSLAEYNGQLAFAKANLQFSDIMRNIKLANTIANGGIFTAQDRFGAEERLRQAQVPWDEGMALAGNDFGVLWTEFKTYMFTSMNNIVAQVAVATAALLDIADGPLVKHPLATALEERAAVLLNPPKPEVHQPWAAFHEGFGPQNPNTIAIRKKLAKARQPLGPQP